MHNRVNREVLLQRLQQDTTPRTTISFYKYAHIGNPSLFRDHLYLLLEPIGVLGRIYVAHEGVNAQVSAPTANMEEFRKSSIKLHFSKVADSM